MRLAAVTIGALLLSAGAASTGHPATIAITFETTSSAVIDGGRPGHSAGDLYELKGLLYNRRRSTRPIGRLTDVCVATEPNFGTCWAIYELPTGQILTYGVAEFGSFFDGIVVGGSGAYEGATGSATSNAIPGFPRRRNLFLSLTLPQP